MKNVIFMVVLCLVPAISFAKKQPRLVAHGSFIRSMSAKQAKTLLLSPQRYGRYCKKVHYHMRTADEWTCADISKMLVQKLSKNQASLRQLIRFYSRLKETHGIVSYALGAVKASDSFFKRVFESDGQGIRSVERSQALCRIRDFAYVKKAIIAAAQKKGVHNSPEVAFLQVRGSELYRTDPKFIDGLAMNAGAWFLALAALRLTKSQKVLEHYARMKVDNPFDQIKDLILAARGRLAQLRLKTKVHK